MEQFFIYLYPLVAVVSLAGYLPQVKALIFASSSPKNISVSMWFIWSIGSAISLGYGVFHLKDLMFSFVSGSTLLFCASITCLILYNRYIRFVGPDEGVQIAPVMID